jgi:hypothetical protein
MNREIGAAALQRLLGINKSVLSELAERGIIVRGKKRGPLSHREREPLLPTLARGSRRRGAVRGGADARARLGAASTFSGEQDTHEKFSGTRQKPRRRKDRKAVENSQKRGKSHTPAGFFQTL